MPQPHLLPLLPPLLRLWLSGQGLPWELLDWGCPDPLPPPYVRTCLPAAQQQTLSGQGAAVVLPCHLMHRRHAAAGCRSPAPPPAPQLLRLVACCHLRPAPHGCCCYWWGMRAERALQLNCHHLHLLLLLPPHLLPVLCQHHHAWDCCHCCAAHVWAPQYCSRCRHGEPLAGLPPLHQPRWAWRVEGTGQLPHLRGHRQRRPQRQGPGQCCWPEHHLPLQC